MKLSPRRARLLSSLVLGAGIVSAVVVFATAPAQGDLPPGYDVTRTKSYRHQLEMYGGHANVLFDEFLRGFGALWHGRPLAGTILVLAAGGAVVIRIAARLAEGP